MLDKQDLQDERYLEANGNWFGSYCIRDQRIKTEKKDEEYYLSFEVRVFLEQDRFEKKAKLHIMFVKEHLIANELGFGCKLDITPLLSIPIPWRKNLNSN